MPLASIVAEIVAENHVFGFYCSGDSGEPALGTAEAILQDSLPRRVRYNFG
jgi:hypothetical protein